MIKGLLLKKCPSMFKNVLIQQGQNQMFFSLGWLAINKVFVVLVQKVIVDSGIQFWPHTLQLITNLLATQSKSDVRHKKRKLRRN